MAECCVHSGVEASRKCITCGREFCSICFLTAEDQVCRYCRNRVPSMANVQTPFTPMSYPTSAAGAPTVNSSKALAALILSIVGIIFCGCGIIFEIIGLIMASMAKKEIRQNPGMGGESNATAALWISIIGIVLSVMWLTFLIIMVIIGAATHA